MERITSFCVDHRKIYPGVYISRIDGDITTYDIRMKKPNCGDYLSAEEAHTTEHLFATFARNSFLKDSVIYVGPMGCLTGFYLLVRDADHGEVLKMLKEAFAFIRDFSGTVPGASEIECGNYRLMDLAGAKEQARSFCRVLEDLDPKRLNY